MLAYGAEQVLIDGSIDRRAASSPAVADGLVIATGAVLGEEIEAVVAATRDAVELVRLPLADAGPADASNDGSTGPVLERGLVLGAEPAEIAALLREHPGASTFHVEGALSERFLEGLLAARTAARRTRAEDRRGRPDEGLPDAPRAGLVPPSGRGDRGAQDDRAEGDHGQPRGAPIAPLRLPASCAS